MAEFGIKEPQSQFIINYTCAKKKKKQKQAVHILKHS